MFAVIYQFNVNPGMERSFIQAWDRITRLIIEHEKSLGSRLHVSENGYIAYAQWPSAEHFIKSGDKLPPEAERWSSQMSECCSDIAIIHELELVKDLLIHP